LSGLERAFRERVTESERLVTLYDRPRTSFSPLSTPPSSFAHTCDGSLQDENQRLQEELFNFKLASNENALRRVKKTIEAMRAGCLKSTFVGWKKFASEENAAKLKGVKFLAKLVRANEVRCFIRWTVFVTSRKHSRRLANRVFSRLVQKELVGGLESWKEWVKEEQRNEFVMRRVGMMIVKGGLTRTLKAWVAFTASSLEEKKDEGRRQNILKKTLMKIKMAIFSRIVLAWAGFAKQCRRERQLLAKFGARMKMKSAFTALNVWRANVAEKLHQKAICWRVLCRIANAKAAGAWRAWMEMVRELQMEEKQAEWQQAQLGMVGMAQAQERNKNRRDMARAGKERQESEEERRERVVKSSLMKILNKAVSNAWRGWTVYMERRLRAKYLCGKVLGRIIGGLMGCGFVTWVAFVERMNWQKNVLGKFVAKMKNQKVFKLFTLWGRWVAEEKRYRVVIGRFLAKLKNRFVLAVFGTWVDYKNTRRWLRGLLNKMVGGAEFKMMSSAWGSWGVAVRDSKMMEALGGSGEEVERLKLALAKRGEESAAEANVKMRLTKFFSKIIDSEAEGLLNRRAMQYAFSRWTGYKLVGRGGGGSLEVLDVDRIDNYMVM